MFPFPAVYIRHTYTIYELSNYQKQLACVPNVYLIARFVCLHDNPELYRLRKERLPTVSSVTLKVPNIQWRSAHRHKKLKLIMKQGIYGFTKILFKYILAPDTCHMCRLIERAVKMHGMCEIRIPWKMCGWLNSRVNGKTEWWIGITDLSQSYPWHWAMATDWKTSTTFLCTSQY